MRFLRFYCGGAIEPSPSVPAHHSPLVLSFHAPLIGPDNPLEGVTHYNIGVGLTPDRFDVTNATVVVPTTEIVIDGLEPTTRYYYRIAAVNAVGASPFTVALFEETAAGVPEAPVISLSGAGDGAVPAIAWDEPELNGATLQGYRVTVAGDAEFSGADGEFNDDLAATALDYDLDDPDLPVGTRAF